MFLPLALLALSCGGDPEASPIAWDGEDHFPRRFSPESYGDAPVPDLTTTGVFLGPKADISEISLSADPLFRPEWSGSDGTTRPWVDPGLAGLVAGREFEASENWGAAAGAYQLAVEQSPRLIPAYERLANALGRLGYPERVLETFRQAVALDSSYALGHANIGRILEQRGLLEEAAAAYQRAVDAAPTYGPNYLLLAQAQVALGRPVPALVALERAGELMPAQRPLLLEAQAAILDRMGRREDARRMREAAARLRGEGGGR